MRNVVRLSLMVLVIASLAGCSGATNTPDSDLTTDAELPNSPVSDRMVRCVSDEGFEIVRSLYGGFDGPGDLPAAQVEKFNQAFGRCADETGWSTPLAAFTSEQVAELYAQEIATRDCLAERGYPGAEPPTEQTYVDNFASADQYYAFMAIADLHQSEQEPLIRACPPPTWFLDISGFGE